jgi:hypothetical protein
MAIKKEYFIEDIEMYSTVYEFKTQKEILEVLDEQLENAEVFGEKVFEDEHFSILYNDGSIYERMEDIEDGTYKKKNIKAIVYTNCNDTWVYGQYEVNEYGVVTYVE